MSLRSRVDRIERQATEDRSDLTSVEVWEQIGADAWRMRTTGEVLSLASVEARPGVAGQISRILVELSAEFWEPAMTCSLRTPTTWSHVSFALMNLPTAGP